MKVEVISNIEVLDSGILLLRLESGGEPSYQYVYRAGDAVYWDEGFKGFHSAEPTKELSYCDWFLHIVSVVHAEMGLKLELSSSVGRINISEETKSQILNKA